MVALASESMAVELQISSFSLGATFPQPSQWANTWEGPFPKASNPFSCSPNVAVYIWCFLSPKQFLNSTNCHKSLPGHVECGKLAQLPAEKDTCSAREPPFIFMVLSWLIEHRSSLGCPLWARWGFRHQGYKEEHDTVPFLQDLQCGRETDKKTRKTWSSRLSSIGQNDTEQRSGPLFGSGELGHGRADERKKRGFYKERAACIEAYTSFVQTL